jgi:hypothetical protein
MEQQTLKEAAKKYKDLRLPDDHYDAFIAGATWQAKKTLYTEEQVKEAICLGRDMSNWWDMEFKYESNEIIELLKHDNKL